MLFMHSLGLYMYICKKNPVQLDGAPVNLKKRAIN